MVVLIHQTHVKQLATPSGLRANGNILFCQTFFQMATREPASHRLRAVSRRNQGPAGRWKLNHRYINVPATASPKANGLSPGGGGEGDGKRRRRKIQFTTVGDPGHDKFLNDLFLMHS